jgi:cation transport protein ChaC
MPRQMRLTPDLVARIPPGVGATPEAAGLTLASDADHAEVLRGILASHQPGGPFHVFAYGSLIWNPGFAVAEALPARLHGWRRRFCLGWMTLFRGCPERPGLMLALDHGGACSGLLLRLEPRGLEDALITLIRRELPYRRDAGGEALPPRWVPVRTAQGPRRALVFPINRKSAVYVGGVSEAEVVASLATSAGEAGSMAEYLRSTVAHLEAHGIHDRYLWRMQDLVAARIAATWPEVAIGPTPGGAAPGAPGIFVPK